MSKEEGSKTAGEKTAVKREEEILAFWEKEKIFEESVEHPAGLEKPVGDFVFYDGPPFATGLPHFGHLLPTTLKDVIPRYKTMRGFRVRRRWGWDCHGLPIENIIERELGLESKKDIEELGIDKFNEAARGAVLRYTGEWCSIIPRIGRWVDMKNDYRTMDTTYSESVWWAFKTLYDKGLVYEGFKSMHLCPRCETTLSNFEVNQGYKDITDISVYVKMELIDEPGTYLLAWTTTPWTLPGNVALAINNEEVYGVYEVDGSKVILLKSRAEKVLEGKEYSLIEEIKGEKLVGKSYKPVFDYYSNDDKLKNKENGWKVYSADFVTTEDGTGVVHIAPAFGDDDYQLSLRENLPFIQHVTKDGHMKNEVVDFKGLPVKPKSSEKDGHQSTDVEIIKYLAKNEVLFKKEKILHSYPHCWRCDTPLINYATSSWFVKVTDLKDKLIEENKKIKWIPETIGENRFGKWLEGARDWAVSRQRFWGAPIPVWKCDKCEAPHVIGGIKDLKSHMKPRNRYIVMRHGEGEHNVLNITTSDTHKKYHLTEKGRGDVELVAQALSNQKIDMIFSSPLTRGVETAQIVKESSGFKAEVMTDLRLREYDFGAYDGKHYEEYHRYFNTVKEQLDKRLPDGENIRDVARRVGEFIYEIDGKYENKTILIVTHDAPASMFFALAAGGSDNDLIDYWQGDFLRTAEAKELEFLPLPHNKDYRVDVHRPQIDRLEWDCSCGGRYKRVTDVFDCWFESGSMPFAEIHYPMKHADEFMGKHFPADFIAEGLDQTRGWFYTMLVLGVGLFGKSPYKNVIVNGLVLAEDGQKMSKSKNNFPPLTGTLEKYGADALRYFMMTSTGVKAEDFCFSEKFVDEVNKKILLRLDNVASFYEMYAGAGDVKNQASTNILDQWILARVTETAVTMTENFERYEIDRAVRPLGTLIDDLSTWYLRRSRDRFKSEIEKDRLEAISTTRAVLLEVSRLIAPIMPFYAEVLYKKMKGERKSVHLESWPIYASVDEVILKNMKLTREVVERGLSIRNEKKIKVRQPLASFVYSGETLSHEYESIIAEELNVKEVKHGEKDELDTNITPKLKMEGEMRELVRMIQDKRKEEDWNVGDRGILHIDTDASGLEMISVYKEEIKKTAGLSEIIAKEGEFAFRIEKS